MIRLHISCLGCGEEDTIDDFIPSADCKFEKVQVDNKGFYFRCKCCQSSPIDSKALLIEIEEI